MSYLFCAFGCWLVMFGYIYQVLGYTVQLLHRVHSAPTSQHVHNNYHSNNTPSPLHLPSVVAYSIMMEKPTQPWWRWGGARPPSFPKYLPSRTKLWCALQLRGQIHSPYFCSTPTCTLYSVMQAFSTIYSILFMWWSVEAEFMNVQYRLGFWA